MSTSAIAELMPLQSGELRYETLERINVRRPVERVGFIASLCHNKHVLDIGCLDETAVEKQETREWLHREVASLAKSVVGIDSSDRLPPEGLVTGLNSRICKGNGMDPDPALFNSGAIEVIVAGEFIEHIDNPLAFLRAMKQRFPGRTLMLSTPNGASFANGLLGAIGREAQHPDHLMTSTYKTLNTLCRLAGFTDWDIIPYRFYATEMMLRSSGLKRYAVRAAELFIRMAERISPLRSFGYVVRITI